jgi:Uncharacterized protein conserved in bacteria (DUF2252)
MARKAVGVGSVGTRAWILLMDACDGVEPLFLQAGEAQPSVLAGYSARSRYSNQGERVVAGQHLMQAQSDIFLGLGPRHRPGMIDRDFYVRQLRDRKTPRRSSRCPGGHDGLRPAVRVDPGPGAPRSDDRVAHAAYLGGSAKFGQAIAGFAETYVGQNERVYAALQNAVKESGMSLE